MYTIHKRHTPEADPAGGGGNGSGSKDQEVQSADSKHSTATVDNLIFSKGQPQMKDPVSVNPEGLPESLFLVKNPLSRSTVLKALKAGASDAFGECEAMLVSQLSSEEREALRFVNAQPMSDGAWYRPIHNLVVTMAMVRICTSTGANRDLVLAAILHDVGYSGLDIPGTLEGAAWDKKDVRQAHMEAGRVMSDQYLRQRVAKGCLHLSEERIGALIEIVGTHDNPYIGKPLIDPEALLHRDADRLFVISSTSFWKDYLAHISDPLKLAEVEAANLGPTPAALLEQRRRTFERVDSETVSPNDGFEPMTTEYANRAVHAQLAARTAEIQELLPRLSENMESPDRLAAWFRQAIVDEFRGTFSGETR